MTDEVEVAEVTVASDEIVSDIVHLLTQLSSRPSDVTATLAREAITSDATRVLVARMGGRTVGTLTLAIFAIPSGRRAWIEDVVVDENARRLGVGEILVRRAVEVATDARVRTVDLTSRSSRSEAHALYQKVGFAVRDTNVYRFDVEVI
jgi:ribosomal protein S18 acetylase RimI-like enzyme